MHLVTRVAASASLALAAFAFIVPAAQAAPPNYLYVGDYFGNQVIKFDGDTGAVITAPYISLFGAEGIGGTNDALAVASDAGGIYLYNTTGATPTLVRTYATPPGRAMRLNFSNDGKTLYANERGDSGNGGIVRYNVQSGAITGFISTGPEFWGNAVNPVTGEVIVTSNWRSSSGGGVYSADFGTSSINTIVAPDSNGRLTHYVGVTWAKDGNSFYAVNGGSSGAYTDSWVDHFSANGTFLGRFDTGGADTNMMMGVNGDYNPGDPGYDLSKDPLIGAWDTEIGPDGNLYVTSFLGACAVKFDITSPLGGGYGDWSVFIPAHAGGLQSAKTIHFTSNSVDANIVPEPGVVAFGMIAAGSVVGLIARRKPA